MEKIPNTAVLSDENKSSDIDKAAVTGCATGRIEVENSKSYWAVNANYPNNWTLQKDYFLLGKNWLHDKSGFHVFGWIEEIMYGENMGKISAGVPHFDEDDPESDALDLGVFDTVDGAMKAVLKNNFPDYSCRYF